MFSLFFRYNGMWFGQKEKGTAGFFESEKVIRADDDDQGMLNFYQYSFS